MGKVNMGGCQGKESNVRVVPDHDKPISEKTMHVKKEEKNNPLTMVWNKREATTKGKMVFFLQKHLCVPFLVMVQM